MILLLGGTSETVAIASALADAGFNVLVSTATDVPLNVGDHPNISRRSGRLDPDQMAQLANQQGVIAIVDASHPYAASRAGKCAWCSRSAQDSVSFMD